ncbi:cytochrome P450 oxidoreductase OrdA-like protein [Hymenopellis radicata]|nr:cytochrome P450 oxidoreductase OrdA-like protein [Hymenopellis radicata]
MTTPIPQPPTIPLLGTRRLWIAKCPCILHSLAKKYGEIVQLDLLGEAPSFHHITPLLTRHVDVEFTGYKIVLLNVRALVHDGLFTAFGNEPNWGIAHRVLMPAFGTANIRAMLPDMRDICDQMLLKWERFGPHQLIDPTDDFTRVALDTLAFCTMSYRLNSFYSVEPPQFAKSMGEFLKECYYRTKRPGLVQSWMKSTNAKYESDMKVMKDVGNAIIAERKANPTEKKDLLNVMLSGRDPKTGEGLSEETICNNVSHETSSGMLSFTVYRLLKYPEVMRKVRAEVDEVLQGRRIEVEDFDKLPYLVAVMRESLRLCPAAPARGAAAKEDTTIGNGKYFVKAGVPLVIQQWVMQRDPKVWGDDAQEFRPERMLDGKFEALPANAWQPFGYGMRGCIGRPFAWQEIILVLVSMIQKFDISFADPSYTLQIQQTMTLKPKNLRIRARLRTDGPRLSASSALNVKRMYDSPAPSVKGSIPTPGDAKATLYVLYGSNTGTSESFSQRIAGEAVSYGFAAKIGTLDSITGHLPTDGPVVIVTASFEGRCQPADNAARFVDWISHLEGQQLAGVKYTVFGCGNSEWVQTYQRIPKLCDSLIEEHGGERLLSRGEGDASQGQFFQIFDEYEGKLWETLSTVLDDGDERAETLRQPDTAMGRLVENKLLTPPGHPAKRHLEFELPAGMSFNAGDYLAILPHNPIRDIFISGDSPTSLPVGKKVSLVEILSGYVELSQIATTKDIQTLLTAASSDDTLNALEDLKASYTDHVASKRLSVLDLLEKYQDINLSLGAFLRMLPAMRVRQYSISSSPLWKPENVTLTISVIEAPALSGEDKVFLGVASHYLSQLLPGDRVRMTVRHSAAAFHLPEDPSVPAVMFCAGSGIAPMRGFMQERAMQKISGREVGKMLLFFGCRDPEVDYLYGEVELKEWIDLGILDVRPAFSRKLEASHGCKYVQDRIWAERLEIMEAYEKGAKFFTCGSGQVAKGIKLKLIDLLEDVHKLDRAQATEKFEQVTKGRYATDVFD